MTTQFRPEQNHMNRVCEAEREAQRFLLRVKQWRQASVGDLIGSKENAAMKRASMDLTRALAVMRKSPYQEDV